MKIYAKDMPGFLKTTGGKSKAALIFGPDSGLISERLKEIALTIVKDIKDPFNVGEIQMEQTKENPGIIAQELSALSFTGERRLVILKNATDTATPLVKEALDNSGNSFLIITADELGTRSSLRQYFERDELLGAIPCYHDEGRDLETLLLSELAKHGLSCDRDTMEYLRDNLGSDRRVTLNEIEKLALYMGEERQLTEDVVKLLIGNNTEVDFDHISLAVASGQQKQVRVSLEKAFREGMHSVALLRALQRYFQRLYQAVGYMQEGASAEAAMEQLKPAVFYKHKPIFKAHLSVWKKPQIERVLKRLQQAEKEVKSLPVPHELICSHCLMQVASLANSARSAAA